MTFQDFLAKIQAARIEEVRAHTEEYLEVVISQPSLDLVNQILTAYFGTPLKPAGHATSGEASRLAEPYGGIRKDQTMYFRRDGDSSECALLWPWGSGARVTIKISHSKSSGSRGSWMSFLKSFFGGK